MSSNSTLTLGAACDAPFTLSATEVTCDPVRGTHERGSRAMCAQHATKWQLPASQSWSPHEGLDPERTLPGSTKSPADLHTAQANVRLNSHLAGGVARSGLHCACGISAGLLGLRQRIVHPRQDRIKLGLHERVDRTISATTAISSDGRHSQWRCGVSAAPSDGYVAACFVVEAAPAPVTPSTGA